MKNHVNIVWTLYGIGSLLVVTAIGIYSIQVALAMAGVLSIVGAFFVWISSD